MEDFLNKDLTCRLCDKEFSATVVRKSKQQVLKKDGDFCFHYAKEVPFYYNVFICPHCGYGFLESFEKEPGAGMREKIAPLPEDYSGRRDNDLAEKAYLRAIECAKMQKENFAVLASLYLQLAWIYRFREDGEKEQAALNEALGYYIDVYEKTDMGDPSKIMYLIGELHRRLGKEKEAVKWFSRVANDKEGNQAMRRLARNAWQSLRE